jgi:hypothetical protein
MPGDFPSAGPTANHQFPGGRQRREPSCSGLQDINGKVPPLVARVSLDGGTPRSETNLAEYLSTQSEFYVNRTGKPHVLGVVRAQHQ